jgi:hypothetical protein
MLSRLPVRSARGRFAVAFAFATVAHAAAAGAQCVLVRERDGALYVPHLALHFGAATDVPRNVLCASPLDKGAGSFCVPVYAYDLWEGADRFEFSVTTPASPLGFERGPAIASYEMSVQDDPTGVVTSLRLYAAKKECGPLLLGCLRLPTHDLPNAFAIPVEPHRATGRRAVRAANGDWRALAVDAGGARIGAGASCPTNECELAVAIDDLRAVPGERPGLIDVSWVPGSAPFTMLRYRTDGRYPSDPWDGDLLAYVPSSILSTTVLTPHSGTLHIAAWSIARGGFGQLLAASSMECGSLASVTVHLPVGVAMRHWTQVKALYR